MAEQYAPIAKDSSLNTTDLTPKNIADVLQDGLATLANSVKPTADEIPFDNTGTSLVSTDVEGAIKEVFGSAIKTTTQVTNSPTAKINIPSSGDYIGFVYITNYTGSSIIEQGGFYVIKRYHEISGDCTHITTVKAQSTRTLSSYTENANTLDLTFSSNLSSFVQAVVFKL